MKDLRTSLASLKSEAEREEIAEAERKAKKKRLLGMGLAGGRPLGQLSWYVRATRTEAGTEEIVLKFSIYVVCVIIYPVVFQSYMVSDV